MQTVDELVKDLVPRVLGTLMRKYGQFDLCEDAVQDALLEATVSWRESGLPDNPAAWLVTAASRRLIDRVRSESARRRREETVHALEEPTVRDEPLTDRDDSLILLFLCCHPSLSDESQLALTLRAVGGLTTAQIAKAFLVPEATMGQRISRAKQRIKTSGGRFEMPPESERAKRLDVVLHVLYLIFNEGYTSTSGPELHQVELTGEAIRLTRALRRMLPEDTEIAGLLALMLLTDARSAVRTGPDGSLTPLAEQDRGRWDAEAIAEGIALTTEALASGPLGPYQLQAAIAAVHAEAPSTEATDWAQIVLLYELLERLAPNPMVTLNHAIAAAMADGPQTGLDLLKPLDDDPRVAKGHRLPAVRAHLLEMTGDRPAARASYELAASRTESIPERNYLLAKAEALPEPG
ncbi:RNA polymerase sigma factor, sigma-70 family [Amycolatopsis xylanica]|uniref:RNA polymerase sigma factor, sigma-70 family n=1 Tax=Amycolatopsis xylanica TaxID=589385 RepID=A0A1H3DVF9_9PSEU|nr:sigma-70 family RNA polymerase sigma factor [Amycolatopsis xylanica]SDX70341.1 RNA polymerase sigma factor, sigma-70 family [Amycolatopsis xylanica]